ncbi:S-adenosylmethionine-dependent methyltransferase [Talaromyces proteolyticus]|uniref:Protein-lysine N-methyltransferase EFM4 n=1 Tax=Talaromyces proteolyticus TaxID=1131652 RepID=A0AAD4KJ89_9EURO|nr:S-adenosylmethionine-dependent methyltransferase [Talaromyces proteolyticus]KAH8692914.1 S-adenosylmethionine-dependent methyltransferase [Talaromyces proteolyticus]
MAQEGPDPKDDHPQYLDPSELGTKEYWETYYKRSLEYLSSKKTDAILLTTATENPSDNDNDDEVRGDDDDDIGTSWFSEHQAARKVLKFLTSRSFPLSPRNTSSAQTTILDLGTGNGGMLALLRRKGGFSGDMVGVDYSAQSVQLARELQRLKVSTGYATDKEYDSDDSEGDQDEEGEGDGGEAEQRDIRFEEWDVLDPVNEDALAQRGGKRISWFPYDRNGFDIVLDKGTFDAVSLSDETIAEETSTSNKDDSEKSDRNGKIVQQRICHKYPLMAAKLVRPGGFLVVTSCNWTEEELVRWFLATGDLRVWGRVDYPQFGFGGYQGQGVYTVCFERKS